MFGALERGLGVNWENLVSKENKSLFESPQNDDQKIKFSNMIQFYMGVINIYLYVEGKISCNMGEVIEYDDIKDDFSDILNAALERGGVEGAVLDFINNKKDQFNINEEISDDDKTAIINQFRTQYLIVK